jgi:hypothetical protein
MQAQLQLWARHLFYVHRTYTAKKNTLLIATDWANTDLLQQVPQAHRKFYSAMHSLVSHGACMSSSELAL